MIDPYINPNTNVLKNKPGITEQKVLEDVENIVVTNKFFDVEDVKGNFDYQHLMDIHRHLFGDLYEWAGEARIIDITKSENVLSGLSVTYGHHKKITVEASKAIEEMKGVKWHELKSYDEKTQSFSKHYSKLWKIHPFREGNTRTVTEFCVQYAATQNIYLDREVIARNPAFLRDSLVLASIGEYSEYTHIERIVKDSMQRGDELRKEKKEERNNIFSLKGLKEIDLTINSKDRTKDNRSRETDKGERE
ncbi:Fic/DOC family protein [Alkalihalobacterium bogoriense]|uniref:Fic/DOC family protein n=1 Tax=Alkalihalobacterium bogoriense TaxID=246272 RepID=UPI0006883CD8|nr:Fic family protein [Alkalihalobacterium bogoriense]